MLMPGNRRDPNVGIIYVDRDLRPTPPSERELLAQAAAAPSLSDYVGKMGWMNPIYGQLRAAIARECIAAMASGGC